MLHMILTAPHPSVAGVHTANAFVIFVSGDKYFGGSATDRREFCTCLCPERVSSASMDIFSGQFSSVQFVTLLKQNVLRGCRLA